MRDWSSCVGSDKVIRTRWGADQERMWLKPHPRRIIGWQNTEVGRTEGESKEWRKKDHIRSNDTDVFHNLFFDSCFYVFWCRHAFRWLLTHFHPCIIKTIQFRLILLVIMNRGSRFYFWHIIVLACELSTHDRLSSYQLLIFLLAPRMRCRTSWHAIQIHKVKVRIRKGLVMFDFRSYSSR